LREIHGSQGAAGKVRRKNQKAKKREGGQKGGIRRKDKTSKRKLISKGFCQPRMSYGVKGRNYSAGPTLWLRGEKRKAEERKDSEKRKEMGKEGEGKKKLKLRAGIQKWGGLL